MWQTLIKSKLILTHDVKRVILRYLNFGKEDRIQPVFHYVESLTEEEVINQLNGLNELYADRHFDLSEAWLSNYHKLGPSFASPNWSVARQSLLGAYFTLEYSVESAALFNPSMVLMGNVGEDGSQNFVMSLRSTGEGHISSISFLEGTIAADASITVSDRDRKINAGTILPTEDEEEYDVVFDPTIPLNSRILFPVSRGECNGMEDVRLTRMKLDDGEEIYYGTYTAYNGKTIMPKLIRTRNFLHFEIRRLHGNAVMDKGMAFFPEKVNGKFVVTGRQDGRHSTIMFSDVLTHQHEYKVLLKLRYDWDVLQMGNCGSPVKTPHGWLLPTHTVGPMRRYVLSMVLLDLDAPARVQATLSQPYYSPMLLKEKDICPMFYILVALLSGIKI
ncbi:MAG: glycosidase [Saprospiraceae bacterium]|nr:glycosidase [Saprospiraceae bacterium]